ncbi:VCBS repeat-containing protein [Oceanirhabdus seepicola]|uniref:VCBS repeat-containing protein n=1 Tax=Oceanirhabdus seepicola TaxID=2828781 RepID=A0A9J6NYB5_9CLOT|nr:VCBS repeat-containing protein [Oceanirhabdus seepicola]MCM1989434.1 VCBS repeat-containing protein [Oceanirhabdus seepicola]
MHYYPPYRELQKQNNYIYILDFKQQDVNGDNIIDSIYLVGDKPNEIESPFTDNIALLIHDGKTNISTTISLKENAGYNPTIFLGDFTGNKVSDILISIDSGGSGGYGFYYIYSYISNTLEKIFDHAKFNQEYKYDVIYKDYDEVEVKEKDKSKKYIIDIKYKGKEYLSEIYDSNGRLKVPIQGWVNPLGGLYPVDFQRDGTYELYAYQRIAGRYNADGLGYVQTSLKWTEGEFVPFFQTVGIQG